MKNTEVQHNRLLDFFCAALDWVTVVCGLVTYADTSLQSIAVLQRRHYALKLGRGNLSSDKQCYCRPVTFSRIKLLNI
jgi:hypothetical protein